MKKCLVLLLLGLSFACQAADYESTMLVQTGKLRESDLIVRTVTDLDSGKICLAFYVSTTGTSPVISCYDARQGYRSRVRQVGHFKEGKLVVKGTTDYQMEKDILWDKIKTYEGYKDELIADIRVENTDVYGYHTVVSGDTLSKIAKNCLGNASLYPKIFEANRNILDNPDLIKVGQKLTIPNRD